MVIIQVMGGLGNQLYQYAMYQKLNSLGKDVRLDFFNYTQEAGELKDWRPLELTRFKNLEYKCASNEERTRLLDNSMTLVSRIRRKLTGRNKKELVETSPYMHEVLEADEVYLSGFWECDKYYEGMNLRLDFPENNNPLNIKAIEDIKTANSVSLHIRRTDYLTVADGKRYTGICTDEYYRAAIEYIKSKVENPEFYIFSDDPCYAKANFTDKNMHVVDWNKGADSIFDLELMSLCKYNITANSTFSFWGAKLNSFENKIMVRPLYHDNYEKDKLAVEEIKDNWKFWVLIDEKGNIC